MAGRRMLEQAVVLDPTFAMAHRRLAVVSPRTGDPDAAVLALRRAFELRDHLPEVERLLVEAFYYSEVAFDGAARETAYRAAAKFGGKGLELRALSAVDVAAWDLVAQAAGMPLYKVLGGPVAPAVP